MAPIPTVESGRGDSVQSSIQNIGSLEDVCEAVEPAVEAAGAAEEDDLEWEKPLTLL